jgi:hypothetical protein
VFEAQNFMPRIALERRSDRPNLGAAALALSIALHGALLVWVEVRGLARPVPVHALIDSWLGPGIEVDAIAPVPAATPGAATPALPAPAAEAGDPAPRATDEPRARAPRSDSLAVAPRARRSANASPPRPGAAPEPTSAGSAAAPPAVAPEGTGTPSTAAFGAAGLPAGVRHLPKAFTRAIGIASRGDPRWLDLPEGTVGETRIELPVDEEGRLGELTYPDAKERDALAPVVRHLLENTVLLLASGRFSLDPSKVDAGVERLRVRVEVAERPASEAADGDPNGLQELEYEPPKGRQPGRGSFSLNSGRRVIGWVYVE